MGEMPGALDGFEPRARDCGEHPYPDAWSDPHGYLRVDLPNRALDPKKASDLFHRYWDEYLIADELGLDLMLNEHHQTATCMNSTSVVSLR